MSENVEVRLSFWPSGLIDGKARVVEMIVQPSELAGICVDPKAHCPMGCFSCPFGEKKCEEVKEEDWKVFLTKDAEESKNPS